MEKTRRKFMKDVAMAGVSVVALPMFLGGCEDVLAQIRNRPVRRCIRNSDLVNDQLDIYRAAVSAMKALPSNDPRNWTRQAEIHNNFCPHGNWFFFPWHRVYLYYFEEICRELTNESDFGLPYWDWCVEPKLPAQFWGSPNSLNNSTRLCTPSSVASASAVGLSLVDGYCNETNFNIFAGGSSSSLRPAQPSQYGNIEGTPHNYIHGTFVRGDMATFMSPLDPIFWSHHCMVDLCWYEWNILRQHPNSNDQFWLDFDYSGMFVDRSGNPASMTTQASFLLPLLSYRYETGIDCVTTEDMKSITSGDKEAFEKTKEIVKKGASIKLDVKERFAIADTSVFVTKRGTNLQLPVEFGSFERAISGEEERIVMRLRGVSEPKDSDAFLRVFLNLNDANMETPTSDVHYAGSFYFFSHSREAKVESVDFVVDISETLRKLRSSNELSNDISSVSVTLVTVPIDEEDNSDLTTTIREVEFSVAGVSTLKMDLN